MNHDIRKKLEERALPESVPFQSRIVNTSYPVLGSRMVEMRKIAKSLCGEIDLSSQDDDIYYEEVLIRGLALAYQKRSILDKKELIKDYIKRVDSWALVDSFCSTFKIKHSERKQLLALLKEYLKSDEEFEIRFAQIMLLSHFLKYDREGTKLKRPRKLGIEDLGKDIENTYIEEIFTLIDQEYSHFYSSVGAAWLIAEAFLFFPKRTLRFLEDNHLDERTRQLTVKKIRESNIPDREVKDMILKFK